MTRVGPIAASMPAPICLIAGIREGRLRIVAREDYVVNGRKMAKLSIEGVP